MSQENIKDFTVEWTILGLLFVSLLSFAVLFMYANNDGGFGDDNTYFLNSSKNVMNANLLEISNESNIVLNITAQTNPEESFLGSRDSVSTSLNAAGTGKKTWTGMKQLIRWTFTGDVGLTLLSVFGGLIGYLIFYFTYTFVRAGQ